MEERGRDLTNETTLCRVCRKDPELVRRVLGMSKKKWKDINDPSSKARKKADARLGAIEKEYENKAAEQKRRKQNRTPTQLGHARG